MIVSHKIRLNPTEDQAIYFKKACGTVRFAYNWGLARWKELYEAGEKPSALQLKKEFNAIKHEQFPWVSEVSSRCTEYGFTCLGNAFSNFFRRIKNGEEAVGYPKFKTRRSRKSFYVANTEIKLNGHNVSLPRLGWVNMCENLRFNGKINSGVVSWGGGYWWIAITVHVPDIEVPEGKLNGSVGVDLGIKYLATTSDGNECKEHTNPKAIYKYEKKLRRLKRKLDRQRRANNPDNFNENGTTKSRDKCSEWETSNRMKQTEQQITRLEGKIANIRNDAAHKLTTEIAKTYEVICVESLNIKGMMKNKRLSKAVGDAAMFEKRRQLEYKSERYGGQVVAVSQWFPSSKTCHACGWVKAELTLSTREWACQECGVIHHRDGNAAENIRLEGLRIYNE